MTIDDYYPGMLVKLKPGALTLNPNSKYELQGKPSVDPGYPYGRVMRKATIFDECLLVAWYKLSEEYANTVIRTHMYDIIYFDNLCQVEDDVAAMLALGGNCTFLELDRFDGA